jgi:hypothetical protein
MFMGANKLAERYKCSTDTIRRARLDARFKLKQQNRQGLKQDIDRAINTYNTTGEPKTLFKVKFEESWIKQPKKDTKVGIHIIAGCQHVPFQNRKMQAGLIQLIKDLGDKVKGFHLIGDTLDLNSLSAHEPNKVPLEGITLGYEYKEGNRYLDSFDKVLPNNIEKTYIWGNHEDRWRRHISDINNSKYASALPSPTEALSLEERGYKVYDNWKEDYHLLGKHLQLIHGEFCTRYPARTHMDRMKTSVMFAHTHRIDISYDGEKAGFNIGWGGDPEAPAFSYVSRLTKMNWINGFALVHIDENGNFFTQVMPVYHNKFWYNGVAYGG